MAKSHGRRKKRAFFSITEKERRDRACFGVMPALGLGEMIARLPKAGDSVNVYRVISATILEAKLC
ncbi:hypothetical protein [Spirulina major]|uniref:hypothetical protein n=1 Tax=Spirulina major TaxID=270636 RepID=UPI00093473E0|nr:hypothetical protein [Spirulina major]